MASNKLQQNWKLIFDSTADRQFSKLELTTQKRIINFFERVLQSANPKVKAELLSGKREPFGVIASVIIELFVALMRFILAVKIGHRRDIYRT